VVKDLEKHLEFQSRQFGDFSSLLEQTAIDGGEDGLGAGGPLTDNINIAHEINDTSDDVLKQIIARLQTGLPGEPEINKIQAEIAKIIAKEKAVKEEAAESSAQ
jgi:hypothetical protein